MKERVTGKLIVCESEICKDDDIKSSVAEVSCPGEDYPYDVATADRLALCWNACEGLSDEVIEDGIFSIAALRGYLRGIHGGGHEALAETAFSKLTGRELFES